MTELRTPRLLLREWREEDEALMLAINSDPEVAQYLNRPVDERSVARFFSDVVAHWALHGYGPWALESREPGLEGRFVGLAGAGLLPAALSAAGPAPELGWRLARVAWGRGLATEAAYAAREDAFERLAVPEIVSVIHPENVRSQRVAAKLGMRVERSIRNPIIDRVVDVWAQRADEIGG